MKKEAHWQTKFNQYLRETRIHGFFELKQTETNSLPLSAIETHQYEGLQATQFEGLVWKFSDEDRRQKPCDCVCIPPLPSFIVIKFPDGFYMVLISKIVLLKERKVKSITLQMAKDIAYKIIRL